MLRTIMRVLDDGDDGDDNEGEQLQQKGKRKQELVELNISRSSFPHCPCSSEILHTCKGASQQQALSQLFPTEAGDRKL